MTAATFPRPEVPVPTLETPSVTLRVFDEADAHQQYGYHLRNAIARAVQRSTLVPVEPGAPKRHPLAAPRVNAAEASMVGSAVQLLGALPRLEAEVEWQQAFGTPEGERRAQAKLNETAAVLVELRQGLARLTPPARPGVPYWYVVDVPSVRFTGGVARDEPSATYFVDAGGLSLSTSKWQMLEHYRLSGWNHAPYRVVKDRYYLSDKARRSPELDEAVLWAALQELAQRG